MRRPFGFHRSVVALLFFSLLASLSACSTLGGRLADWDVLSGESARLDERFVMALYVSPQAHDFNAYTHDFGSPGYVLLVDVDGQITAIPHAGLDNGQLIWDDKGLFFSDINHDYLLSPSGLRTWDSEKTEFQTAAFAKPDGTGWVSVYNEGFGDPGAGEFGYVQEVVETNLDGKATRYDVPGFSTQTVMCDGIVYSVSEVVEPYLDLAAAMGARERDVPPLWPDMLSQIYPLPTTWDAAIKSVNLEAGGGHSLRATCHDNALLGVAPNPDWNEPTIISWPVDGQPPTVSRLTAPDGTVLDLSGGMDAGREAEMVATQVLSSAISSDWSPSEQTLVWHGGDGVIRSTNTVDGRTTILWDTDSKQVNSGYDSIVVGDKIVYALTVIGDSSGNPAMRLRSHHFVTGETLDILTFDLKIKQAGPTLVTRGMAIRPGFHTG